MAEGALTSSALVEYYLARIAQFDNQLNALITINGQAKETAEKLDSERAQGSLRGPLHGIPVIVKDNIDTVDMPTTGGCKALATAQPPDDAFVIDRLKAAGAIILAKANLHELAWQGESASSLGGQVHNPYNLDYTPGGSSGGSAAAVAANFAAIALGTDTINSVRSPASACNIVGLRPTAGLVSRDGLMPVALSQDVIGPMGRTVSDVATLLSVIAVNDPEDPMTSRSVGKRGNNSKDNYATALKKSGLKEMRLGIVPSLFGQADHHQPVNQLMEAAIKTLRSLGADCFEIATSIDIEQLIAELSVVQWEFRLHFNQYLETLGSAAPVKNLTAPFEVKEAAPVN